MKRILVLMAVFILLVFALTGCKQTTGETTTDNATTGDASTEDTADINEDTTATTPTTAATPTTAPTAALMETTGETIVEIADNAPVMYKDGVYEVQTEPDYEDFSTHATLTIEGGAITAVDWYIYDTKLEKPFDEEYYHVYESVSEDYVNQAKNDWSGSREYDDVLIETQDISKVDAVSGATWTNNKFQLIVSIALKEAEVPMYKDGVYEVQTEPDYENFYTKATVTILGGAITAVDWCIYDATLDDKPFDAEYYHVYETVSEDYVNQAKNDWSGSRGYTDALIESQEVSNVDAVSGATWTNKKFKEIVNMALALAKN